MILGIILLIIICVFFLFSRLSHCAYDVAKFAWNMAHENQKIRLGQSKEELYKKSTFFKHLIRYFIYPKIQDLQKPFLIIVGYMCGILITNVNVTFNLKNLFLFAIVFDYLAYQARYQINDIRGIKEDKEAGCKNRLISSNTKNEGHLIRISFIIALIKIGLSII